MSTEDKDKGLALSDARPRVSGVSDRRVAWSLWFLPAVIVAIVLIVREVARMDRTLAAEGERASRVLVYELPVGESLRVPIESGTEVIRVVAHARGEDTMALVSHGARVSLHAHGDKGSRTEILDLALPGTRARVRAEEPEIIVADPLGFDVDVHGLGRGELEVKLESIDGAAGLLVRAYRRELLDALEVVRRERVLDRKREEHLALRSWELDWSDVDDVERNELLEGRWRKVGLLRGSRDLAVHALAIAAGPEKASASYNPALVTSLSLVADERATLFTTGQATFFVETDAPSTVYLKREDGSVDRLLARGLFELHAVPRTGVEIETEGGVSIRTDTPGNVEAPIFVRTWRATPTRPVVLESEGESRVLRVVVRRAVPRGWKAPVPIDLTAVFSTDGTPVRLGFPLRGTVVPSTFDRFTGDLASAFEAPTVKLVTHALLSPGKRVQFVPTSDAIDISLGELDPDAPPRTLEARLVGAPLPLANANDETWVGFPPRRPSNAAGFALDETHLLRLARRIVPYVKVPEHTVTRVGSQPVETRVFGGRTFEKITEAPLVVHANGEARWLSLRFMADTACDVTAVIDDGKPRRRNEGLAQHVTVAHSIHVPAGESTAAIVLGDDLEVGLHELSLRVTSGTAWVHAPWIRKKKAPATTVSAAAAARNAAPHWTQGDFDD